MLVLKLQETKYILFFMNEINYGDQQKIIRTRSIHV